MDARHPGAWRTAYSAAADAVRAFGEIPKPYIVILLVSFLVEFVTLPYSLTPEGDLGATAIIFAVYGIQAFVLCSPYIGLVRYFLSGRQDSADYWAGGPVVRVFLISTAFVIGTGLYVLAVLTIGGLLFGDSGLSLIVFAIGVAVLIWYWLRLTTFWVAITLPERPSPNTRFAETRGHMAWLTLVSLAGSIIAVPCLVAVFVLPSLLFGVSLIEEPELPILPSLGQHLLYALLAALIGTAFYVYLAALYARIFTIIGGRRGTGSNNELV